MQVGQASLQNVFAKVFHKVSLLMHRCLLQGAVNRKITEVDLLSSNILAKVQK